ncbi:MAG: nicotinate-nucleotide pyrophosphorylase (carboxylating) [Myxococcota bacterium]|jgi:nicotinate-nucleotide pyrophosphorylase (carboxylating)
MNLRALVQAALDEDVGPGDRTTEACIPERAMGRGRVRAKEPLVMAGHAAAFEAFRATAERVGGVATYTPLVAEGMAVEAGTTIARVEGNLRALLIGERLALNFLMRLCGIATITARHVAAADGRVQVVDTRKTTPLHRQLEKQAVLAGGAANHRYALYDGVMVKDNHITAVGSLTAAVARARAANHHLVRVEVEVGSLDELDEALGTEADVVMLDNMDDAMLVEAVRRTRARKPGVILEASGNMDIERIERIRDVGLDVISVGGLIHQARWADLSMKLDR